MDEQQEIELLKKQVLENGREILKHDGDMNLINEKLDNITKILTSNKSEFATIEHCKMKEREINDLFNKQRTAQKKLDRHIESHNNSNANYIKYFVMAILGSVISLAITKL